MSKTIALVQAPPTWSLTGLVRQGLSKALRSHWLGPFSTKDPALSSIFSDGYRTGTGIPVTHWNAFTFSAVFDAVNQISGDVGKLPLNLLKRREDGGSDPFVASKLYRMLKHEPNPEMGSMELRRTITAHALTWGNGYCEIERDTLGRAVHLWPLTPDRVEVSRARDRRGRLTGPVRYKVDGGETVLNASDVIHIHGLGFDGISGYDIIQLCRQAIGLALAAEQFGASYFGNGTMFGGWLETEDDLDEDQKEEIRKALEKYHKAADHAWKILVTGSGHKFHQFASKPSDSQMDELRNKQVEEVARFFNMPLHKLKSLERATNNNIEQQDLEYYKGCLLTWITLWEEELNRKLIPALESRQQYIKHNANAFLRGDIKSRYEALGIARDKGIINANEWRELEDMNPQEGGQGQLYLVQSAQIPLGQLEAFTQSQIDKNTAPPPAPAAPSGSDDSAARAQHLAEVEAHHATQAALVAATEAKVQAERQAVIAKEEAVEEIASARVAQQAAEHDATEARALVATAEAATVEVNAACLAAVRRATDAAAEAATATAAREAAERQAVEAQALADAARAEQARVEAALTESLARADTATTDRAGALVEAASAQSLAEQALSTAEAAEQARLAAVTAQAEAVAKETAALTAQAAAEADREAARSLVADAEQMASDARQAQQQAEADRDTAVQRAADAELARARAEQAADEARRQQQSDQQTREAAIVEAARSVEAVKLLEADRVAALISAHRSLVVDIMRRMVERETDRARRAQATPEKLRTWMGTFYDGHEALMMAALVPAVTVHLAWTRSTEDPVTMTQGLVRAHLDDSRAQLQAVLDGDADQLAVSLAALLRRWEVDRVSVIADTLFQREIEYAASLRAA